MRIFSWNCQGFVNPSTRTALWNVIREQNPDLIVFLCETKNDSTKMGKYMRRFNYPNNWVSPSVGLSGGMDLMWKSGFNFEIVQNTDKMVNTIISFNPSKPEFICTFLYGSTYYKEKMQQWNYIKEIGNRTDHPWVIISDLNITMASHEISSFSNPTTSSIPEITTIIDGVDLSDLGFIGCQYTWSNRQSPPNLIKARLDRALVNGHWMNHYGNSKVFHIDSIGSSHLPFLLVTDPNSNQGKRPYRYYKCWFRDPASHEVIKNSYV